jgi:hypothetical protein
MGITLRHFIYEKETDNLHIIPSSKFNKLFDRDNSVTLKEYCGKYIKYIEVIIQLENKRPVSIINIVCHIMKIDDDGKFDNNFMNELHVAAAQLINVPISDMPVNVFDSSSDFSEKKFKAKYSWTASEDIKNRVKELIFKNTNKFKDRWR